MMETKQKFESQGKIVVPLMMELVWKEPGPYRHVLPVLLAQWEEKVAIPVIVEGMARYGYYAPDIPGNFYGTDATSYILEALENPKTRFHAGLIHTIGLTGSKAGVPHLVRHLNNDKIETWQAAISSLIMFEEFASLRESFSGINNMDTRLGILEALAKDKSKETINFLCKVATDYSHNRLKHSLYVAERFGAAKALLENPTDKNVAIVCRIAKDEPHANTSLYIHEALGDIDNSLAFEALFDVLGHKGFGIKLIYSLKKFKSKEVETKLFEFINSNPDQRMNAIYSLIYWGTPINDEIVIELLQDEDTEMNRYGLESLEIRPVEKTLSLVIKQLQKEADYFNKRRALDILYEIGGEEVLAALKKAHQEETDYSFKQAIEIRLKQLSTQNNTDY